MKGQGKVWVGASHQINRSGQVRLGQDLSCWEPPGQ